MREHDQLRDQMRTDLNRVVSFRRTNGEWTKEEADECGLAIRAALQSGDQTLIDQWAEWCKRTAATYFGPVPPLPIRYAHACTTCLNRTKPGKSDPGYCAERPELPAAYGPSHPLRQLPTDAGASCPHWKYS